MAGGYRAIESLRLEKGYRVWGSDLTGETDPLSAGLDFCVAWDKPGGFLGRDALAADPGRRSGPAAGLPDPGRSGRWWCSAASRCGWAEPSSAG